MNAGTGANFYDQDPYKTGNAFMNTLPYGQTNALPQKQLISKAFVSAEDIKEMVAKLNSPPFNENMNLASFDELQQYFNFSKF